MTNVVRKRWFFALIGVINLAVGVMFYAVTLAPEVPPVSYEPVSRGSPVALRHSPAAPRIIPATTGIPTRIIVPDLAIDLAVGVGSFNASDASWTIDETKAYYADPSLPANNSNGRTLIYGHAQPQVFGGLPGLQPAAEARVYTDNGRVFYYRYESMRVVVPTDVSVFSADGPPTLVLQTCTGDWDAYRALYSFRFESEEKI